MQCDHRPQISADRFGENFGALDVQTKSLYVYFLRNGRSSEIPKTRKILRIGNFTVIRGLIWSATFRAVHLEDFSTFFQFNKINSRGFLLFQSSVKAFLYSLVSILNTCHQPKLCLCFQLVSFFLPLRPPKALCPSHCNLLSLEQQQSLCRVTLSLTSEQKKTEFRHLETNLRLGGNQKFKKFEKYKFYRSHQTI